MQNGLLFGLPVVLDTQSEDINVGDKVLLTYQGQNIATITIDSKWLPNKPVEALKCYGTSSIEHPAVQMISMERGKYYIGTQSPLDPLMQSLIVLLSLLVLLAFCAEGYMLQQARRLYDKLLQCQKQIVATAEGPLCNRKLQSYMCADTVSFNFF